MKEIAIKPIASASLWVGIYLLLIVFPLGVLLLGERPRGGGFWWDFALMLGYAGLAMAGVQFVLTARFKRVTEPFGIDIIYYFHRYLAVIAFVLLTTHVVLMLTRYPEAVGRIDPRVAPAYMTLGWLSLLAFATIIASSLWRKRLRIEYDVWRRLHLVLAVTAIVMAVLHVHGSGSYLAWPSKYALWTAMALSWLALVLYVRLVRPWRLRQHPYRVAAIRKAPGRAWTLALEPLRPPRLDYRPGQFAWVTLRASPFAMREHPFSFSSSPTRPGPLEFTVKELGDFTSRIGTIEPGEIAYVDGPYGSFGIDRHANAAGFIFIAGGVGIAPIMSMLRALADRSDRRPAWLFYGNRRQERTLFRNELDALTTRLELKIVHVVGEPPKNWKGERGFVTHEVLARHLPSDRQGLHCFVCGPKTMIRLVERSLGHLGVPLRRVHSEIFDLA